MKILLQTTPAVVAIIACAPFMQAQRPANGKAITIEVNSGKFTRKAAIVAFRLPKQMRNHSGFRLYRLPEKEPVSIQYQGKPDHRLVWILQGKLKRGEKLRYQLIADSASAQSKHRRVTCVQDDKGLTVSVGKKPVLRYNTAVIPCPVPKFASCRRSGFFHPVFNPSGQVVTDDFPPDHPHQHGVMFPWVNTTFQKRKVDFWNQAKELGTIEHVELIKKQDGPVFAQFTAKLRHVVLSAPGRRIPALDESWRVRVYNFDEFFLFDVDSRQRCSTDSPLDIHKYHYGGFAFRGARQWFQKGACDFLTSEGKTRKDGNHSRPRWVDIHGKIDGKISGVAILGQPNNLRFPQPVRLHPSKPYFCFSPQVLGGFRITPKQEHVARYRFVVHDRRPDPKTLNVMWREYAQPLEATLVK